MNFIFFGIVIFIIVFLLLSWFVKTSSKKIAKFSRTLILIFSALLAIIFVFAGRFLLSLPLLFLILGMLKVKGLTALQIIQLWRLIQYLRTIGRFSYSQARSSTQSSSSVTLEESYKILGLKKGCSKTEVIKVANNLQKKIHPDMNRDVNTERLSQLVNEAKDTILENL